MLFCIPEADTETDCIWHQEACGEILGEDSVHLGRVIWMHGSNETTLERNQCSLFWQRCFNSKHAICLYLKSNKTTIFASIYFLLFNINYIIIILYCFLVGRSHRRSKNSGGWYQTKPAICTYNISWFFPALKWIHIFIYLFSNCKTTGYARQSFSG